MLLSVQKKVQIKRFLASKFLCHQKMMSSVSTIQVGITGCVGMGKSTVASQLKHLGFPVFDSDQHVHELYSENGGAVKPISLLFPHVIENNTVCRTKLMETIMAKPSALKEVESIVHPLVMNARQQFYQNAAEQGHFLVVYDIPLLFENKANHQVDYTIVVTASPNTQKERVLKRKGMTVDKFESIMAKQMSDEEKRQLADFIIHTDYSGYIEAKAQLGTILEKIIYTNADKWLAWKNRNRFEIVNRHRLSAAPTISNKDTNTASSMMSLKETSNSVELDANSVTAPVFDMLLFDLDDTLCPTKKQLGLAYKAMSEYMEKHMPLSHEDMKVNYVEVSKRIKEEFPLIRHDLNELRLRAMRQIASKHGEEALLVDSAMEVFVSSRNDMEQNLFDDVKACFQWAVSQGMKVGILTNGTADISKCETLKQYISVYLTAADMGAAKPSPVAFIAGIHRSGFLPRRILYIGDSYDHDVLGAKNAGMHSAWLVRDSVVFESNKSHLAAAGISSGSDTSISSPPTSTPNSPTASTFISGSAKLSGINLNVTLTTTSAGTSSSSSATVLDKEAERNLCIDDAPPSVVKDFSQADIVLKSLHPTELEEKLRHFIGRID